MIRCGLDLNLNGFWEERQLSPEVQKIVKIYRKNFDGAPVTTDLDLTQSLRERLGSSQSKIVVNTLFFGTQFLISVTFSTTLFWDNMFSANNIICYNGDISITSKIL